MVRRSLSDKVGYQLSCDGAAILREKLIFRFLRPLDKALADQASFYSVLGRFCGHMPATYLTCHFRPSARKFRPTVWPDGICHAIHFVICW